MSIEFKKRVLDNGLTVIGEIEPTAHSSAIGFFVKTGARDEASAVMGVSHFLEHMMFKGTESRSAAEVDLGFDNIGADHNAFTTSEMTAFYAHSLPEHLPAAEEILSDILRPSLRGQDFTDEKKVILEEIAMYRDNPFWVLYERAQEEFYRQHPLSHRVLGTPETIEAMKRDQMETYFVDRYSADNTVVALAGRFDFDEMADRIAEHCGHWTPTRTARVYPDVENETDAAARQFTIESPMASRHYLIMLASAPAYDDDRRYAAGMLAQILGDSDGSRLYWALIETGVAEEAQAQYDGHDGLGQYLIYCSCSPEDGEKVRELASREADALLDSITEDDLLRVRSKVATGVTLHGEQPAGRMRRLGRMWTYTGVYRSLEEELERLNAITLDELRSVHAAFPIEPKLIGSLTPAEA